MKAHVTPIENPVLYNTNPPCKVPVFCVTEALMNAAITAGINPNSFAIGASPVKNNIIKIIDGEDIDHVLPSDAKITPRKIGAMFLTCLPDPIKDTIPITPPRIGPFNGASKI